MTEAETLNDPIDTLARTFNKRDEAEAQALMENHVFAEEAFNHINRVQIAIVFFLKYCSVDQLVKAINVSQKICDRLFEAKDEYPKFQEVFTKLENKEIECRFTPNPLMGISTVSQPDEVKVVASATPTTTFPRKNSLIGRTIVDVDWRQFDDGRGGKVHDPIFTLDNGKKISFVVDETEIGAYGVRTVMIN